MLRKITVTGGTGFIGRAVAAALEGTAEVTVIDRPGDVRSLMTLDGCDHVIHLAGMLGTAELFEDTRRAIDVNMWGTANVLRLAAAGRAGYTGITMPRAFPSVYQATKTGARELERAWHHSYGVPVSRVRAFNAFGPGQKHGYGHPAKIVPVFATSAWQRRAIPVWGDGEQLVDLIDVAQLGRLIAEATAWGDDFTLDGGTGQPFTVNQVAQMVLDITGSKAGTEHLPMRPGEIARKRPVPEPGWEAVTAQGEGWDRLASPPVFDSKAFEEAVEWYRVPR